MSKIAFYSPLKPATHPVPSGDRLMAQMLIDCLARNAHQVQIASSLRAFLRDPDNVTDMDLLMQRSDQEVQRISASWQQEGVPDLWFCYHPYFKSPDLIGPELCGNFDIPYVTAEAAHSPRRSRGVWGVMQARVLQSIESAAVNICFTQRDRLGLRAAAPSARLASLRPFIDTAEFLRRTPRPEPGHLVTVAMMRPGDKYDSYVKLAAALETLVHLRWTLSVVGDGKLQQEVQGLFSTIPAERISWYGRLDRADIATLFARSALYVWPGCGEAYGLAYLEAQAAGLPVVAFDTAGVPEVVHHGMSGILTPAGDVQAYAQAIRHLLTDEESRQSLASSAAACVRQEHALEQADAALSDILRRYLGKPT